MGARVSQGGAGTAGTAAAALRGSRGLKLAGICAAALAAFFPLTADLVDHFGREPWARYALVFPPLFLWCALHDRAPASSRSGLLWVAAAVTLQALAVAGGVVRYGRHALPLAVLGGARVLGLARLRTALLLLAAVPVPSFLGSMASPTAERTWLSVAGPFLGADARLDYAARAVTGTAGTLSLGYPDAGIVLVALSLGLAWYAGIRLDWAIGRTATALSIGAMGAVALQAIATSSAVVTVSRGGDAAVSRALLTAGPPLLLTLLAVCATEARVYAKRLA